MYIVVAYHGQAKQKLEEVQDSMKKTHYLSLDYCMSPITINICLYISMLLEGEGIHSLVMKTVLRTTRMHRDVSNPPPVIFGLKFILKMALANEVHNYD